MGQSNEAKYVELIQELKTLYLDIRGLNARIAPHNGKEYVALVDKAYSRHSSAQEKLASLQEVYTHNIDDIEADIAEGKIEYKKAQSLFGID